MNEIEFLQKFINDLNIEENRQSSFSIALRNSRMLMGRNIKTGVNEFHILESKNGFLPPYSFIGVVNYLITLEMIGNIFKIPEKPSSGSAINKSLFYFSDLVEKDRYTIDALRNALVHSYSLVNIPSSKKNNSNSRHKFTLDAFSDLPLITYPHIPWNGSFEDKSDETSTIIQTTKLIDLLENIVTKIKATITIDNLAIDLNELKTRYTILV